MRSSTGYTLVPRPRARDTSTLRLDFLTREAHDEGKVAAVNGDSTPVIFVMGQHDLHCNLSIGSARALDIFNDQSTQYLEVTNARFCPRASDEPLVEVRRTVLVKENLHLVVLVGEDRSSERRVFFATRAKTTVHVILSLPTVVVQFHIHLTSATDTPGFLSIQSSTFFPVTNATVLGHTSATQSLKCGAVLVRKDAVSSVALLHKV